MRKRQTRNVERQVDRKYRKEGQENNDENNKKNTHTHTKGKKKEKEKNKGNIVEDRQIKKVKERQRKSQQGCQAIVSNSDLKPHNTIK